MRITRKLTTHFEVILSFSQQWCKLYFRAFTMKAFYCSVIFLFHCTYSVSTNKEKVPVVFTFPEYQYKETQKNVTFGIVQKN